MPEPKSKLKLFARLIILLGIIAGVIWLFINRFSSVGPGLIAIIMFGLIVLFHEFGHFVVAKLMDIKVETFSIGFPPVALGIKRTEKGFRIRVLPSLLSDKPDDGEGGPSFYLGKKAKPGETEYRIGLIPFGGYVKMLGQEDIAPVKQSDDPRSYANKSPFVRMAVVAAGVIFNVIAASIIFVAVFSKGIELMPPVVGDVILNSPAARAGLQLGDEIIEIDGRTYNLDFMDVAEVGALSRTGRQVEFKVRSRDGSVKEFTITPEKIEGLPLRGFGIENAASLIVRKLRPSDANDFFARTGLKSKDRIVSIGGTDVTYDYEYYEKLTQTYAPKAFILAERKDTETEAIRLIESEIDLELAVSSADVSDESELGHICSMLPRLKIEGVSPDLECEGDEPLATGDIILKAGDIESPSYTELRQLTEAHKDAPMTLEVLRAKADGTQKSITVTVVPKKVADRVQIGIVLTLDAEHPVVAKTIQAENGPKKLAIPRGATITAVGNAPVANFYDIIEQIRSSNAGELTIRWRGPDGSRGKAIVSTEVSPKLVTVKSRPVEIIPFEPLMRLYRQPGLSTL